jgi:streptogramin lyase
MGSRTSVLAFSLALSLAADIHAAPSINSPLLSVYLSSSLPGSLTNSVVDVHGQGFGSPDISAQVYVQVGDRTVLSSDPGIKTWQDNRIVVQLAKTVTAGTAVTVHAAGGTASTTVTQAYQIDWFDLTQPGLPNHIGVDLRNRVWVNPEFRRYISMVDPSQSSGNQVTAIAPPEPDSDPPYAGLYGNTLVRTSWSSSGEDLTIDRQGKLWFPEGGLPTTAANNIPSRNRIFFYDRDAVSNNWRVFNLPRDNNSVLGFTLAYDAQNNVNRVWYSSSSHATETYRDPQSGQFYTVTVNDQAKIVSFNPTAICNAPNGNLVCTDGTTFDYSTNINALICPANVQDDSACFHEYPVPNIYQTAHLVVDVDGSVWFANYWRGTALGRLIPASGTLESYPVSPLVGQSASALYLANGLWHVLRLPSGDIGFTEFFNISVGRFKRAMLGESACFSLDPQTQTNPCIDERMPPFVDLVNETILTADYDAPQGNLWFDIGNADLPGQFGGLGYVSPDFSTVVRLPPLSLFPGLGNASGLAGVAVNRTTGDIWAAGFFRNRIVRLRNG